MHLSLWSELETAVRSHFEIALAHYEAYAVCISMLPFGLLVADLSIVVSLCWKMRISV